MVVAGLFAGEQARAIRLDWTAAEQACASSFGFDLESSAEPGNAKFIEHLSWVADRIVIGVVNEVKHELRGPYPTLVTVTVASSLKGAIPASSVITVASMSGPSYSDYWGAIGNRTTGSDNAVYTAGQNVLLFLSTGYHIIPENPSYYALPAGHYRLVDGRKFTLKGGSFVLDGHPSNSYPIANINSRVSALLAAQRTQCEVPPPPPPGGGVGEGGGFDPEPCHPKESNPNECEGVGGVSAGGDMAGGSMSLEMCPDRNSQKDAWNANSTDPEDLEYRPSCPGCGNGLGLAMRRVLRKMMRLTANGQQYLSLWDTHRMEVIAIFDAHPEVGALVGSRVNDFMPGLRTWLYNDVNGSNFTLDATRVAQIEEVVDAIKQYGSATLQADLDSFKVAIRLEQGKSMKAGLAHFVGFTP